MSNNIKNLICVILILVLVYLIYNNKNNNKNNNKENFHNETNIMINGDFIVKPSPVLNFKERGLFAKKHYKKGQTIETCPTLSLSFDDYQKNKANILNQHFFNGTQNNNQLISLGYCSLMNHSENKNCTWKVENNDEILRFVATRDIKAGDELLTNYGHGYWSGRNDTPI